MKYAISLIAILFLFDSKLWAEGLRSSVLRQAAIDAGLVPASDTWPETEPALVDLGKLVFESPLISLGEDMSCATCHRDKFGSADGIPNAVGVGGVGMGNTRAASKGRVVPRNTLPFWGVGGKGYETFFWDGKVNGHGPALVSQFGRLAPSSDPLIVSAMLPSVEIDEMLGDVEGLTNEAVHSAEQIYGVLVDQLSADAKINDAAVAAFNMPADKLSFEDYATSIADFIRFNFAVQDTRFHNFVFEGDHLTDEEISGGLIFYGKGRCAMCHNGPYFSDFDFHAIPSPSSSFGKNGFGVDYGRFNVTNDPNDRGKFRTPPLYNVSKTSPYGHSGAFYEVSDIILAHSDPLAALDFDNIVGPRRQDLYHQMRQWSLEPVSESVLMASEVDALVSFLSTLEYNSKMPVNSPTP